MHWLQAVACGMLIVVTLRMPGMRMVLIGQNAVGCAGFKAIGADSGHSRQQLASTVNLKYTIYGWMLPGMSIPVLYECIIPDSL